MTENNVGLEKEAEVLHIVLSAPPVASMRLVDALVLFYFSFFVVLYNALI